ncbi:response regulator [Flavilitoribacter nigricans]|uniref:DNA-binding response regulator n=1 Tax=Flavilitoribacter nigricans (strain ATCC 23147 / DSM 23189 / NBRC 102662 / NCIMB 1420 / SS-2) TaxID=1122177 RepID=A0A2D0MXH5_FLAN2|nr:response regulator transcription factor [Flavilitoribacter nigricans]PHN00907.1 DNA-binding response regulator [Flavilitoribacter nigricans DSM 23189 = NBRC 102662]
MIKVITVDDHKIFRDGIASLLENDPEIEVVGEAENENQLLELMAKQPADVILMDIHLKDSNGINITIRIKSEMPDVKILAFSMHNQVEYVVKMLEAGASGYLLKDAGKEEMVRAIRVVASGNTYYSNEISNVILQALNRKNEPEVKRNNVLTKREVEVLKLIASEYSNSEIASQLHISVRTVDTHRRNLLEKLNVKNTAGLVKYAMKENILDSE